MTESNEDLKNVEISDELSNDGSTTEKYETITIEDFEAFNMNYVTGSLYTVGAIGILVGVLLGTAFNGIIKR